MKPQSFRALLALVLAAFLTLPACAKPKEVPLADHWVGTWAAANMMLPPAPSAQLGLGAADMTLRQIVHISLGGPLLRVELSNEFGTEPLTISSAHVALADLATPTGIQLASANRLTFGGRPSIVIPPGATALSDPAALNAPTGADLAISILIPQQTLTHVTFHGSAYQTSFIAPGDLVGQKTLTGQKSVFSWYFLRGVDVSVPAQDGAVVALGDSITDGTASTPNENRRWPDLLAHRLATGGKKTRYLSVLNVGIGGNRLLHDGTGPSALARFDRDVLSRPGVKYLVLLEGINDIGHAYSPANAGDVVTLEDLIQADSQIIERAHVHGIRVIGATLTPYLGAGYSSPAGEQVRQGLNTWLRNNKDLDGLVDFDKATATPDERFQPAYDHGDHLHPSDAGMKAMADSFNLKLFDPNPTTKLDIKYFKD